MAQSCAVGATTNHIRSWSERDCFCEAPLLTKRISGTAQGFVCEIQPKDTSIRSAVSAQGITFAGADPSLTLLDTDMLSSRLYVEHQVDDLVLGSTVLVLDSSGISLSIIVNVFVRDLQGRGANVVTSSFSLQDTSANMLLQPLDTHLLSAFLDFDGELSDSRGVVRVEDAMPMATRNKIVVLLVMLMDKQRGLVYKGVLEARMHSESFKLSLVGQTWTEMWRFQTQSYYTTFALPSQFSVIAYQASDTALVTEELSLTGRNMSNTTSYYDLVKLDLLSGKACVNRIVSNKTFVQEVLRPSFFNVNRGDTVVSLCDPSDGPEYRGSELARVDISTWEAVHSSMQSNAHGVGTCPSNVETKTWLQSHQVYISPTQVGIVMYSKFRGLFSRIPMVLRLASCAWSMSLAATEHGQTGKLRLHAHVGLVTRRETVCDRPILHKVISVNDVPRMKIAMAA